MVEMDEMRKIYGLDNKTFIHEVINKSICKIKINEKLYKTGFFCTIKYPDKFNLLHLLLTDSEFSDKKEDLKSIEFTLNKNDKLYKLYLNNERIFYIDYNFDICVIEIKESEFLNEIFFLEISDFLNEDNFDLFIPTSEKLKFHFIYFPMDGPDAK